MDFENLTELACDRMDSLVDQAAAHQKAGDELGKLICISEIEELAQALDDNEEILYMTYHRYLSDSFGVEFEIEHGDPELMFGVT